MILAVSVKGSDAGTLSAWVLGTITGEVVIRASGSAKVTLAGVPVGSYDAGTGTFVISVEPGARTLFEVRD